MLKKATFNETEPSGNTDRGSVADAFTHLLCQTVFGSHQWCHSQCFSIRSSVFFISSSVLVCFYGYLVFFYE